MDQPRLRDLEAHCIQEEQPFCTAACPIHVDVRAFMAALTRGDIREARRILDRTMPFPDIIGRVCDQPCRPFCKRREIGDTLAINDLERYCVSHTQPVLKLPKLPEKGGRVAVIGAGLSGMTAALDLARKGRPATLITPQSEVGGSLLHYPESLLPKEALVQATVLLDRYGVIVRTSAALDQQAISALAQEFDAIYIDFDEIDATLLPFGSSLPDPIALALSQDGFFGGGGTVNPAPYSVITQAENGRRAALSIERYLQKVSLTAQREKEGATSTRMYTVTKGIEPTVEILPADAETGYTSDEAQQEASRCIQCQCLECVKLCVYLREFKEYPKTLVRKVYNNQAIVQGSRTANQMINSCSLCGQCTVICPYDFPVADVCRTARQDMVVEDHMPPSAHDFALEDMRESLGEFCALTRHQPGMSTSRYLLYPGCQLSGSSPEAVKKIYALLTEKLDGGVGLMLGCCGIPAHWAGQQELFAATMHDFQQTIQRMGNPEVITACSSCLSMFREHAVGVTATSIWQVLDRLELPAGTAPRPTQPLAIHDPCTARDQEELRASVRSLCTKQGLDFVEHPCTGELTDCCGYGGLMQMANQPLGKKAALVKAERSDHDGLVYCAMCRDNMAGAGRRVAHLLDYIVGNADGADPLARSNPGFSQRHENRARLKTDLLDTLWQEASAPLPAHRQIPLLLSQEVLDQLNSRHILEEDIQKVIHHAETTGKHLINPENGRRLASFKPMRVTYWVEYQPTDQGYRIHRGYSHRMVLPEPLS